VSIYQFFKTSHVGLNYFFHKSSIQLISSRLVIFMLVKFDRGIFKCSNSLDK
jgi:hypothetical protein